MTKKTAIIISFTPITDEPRVLRQVQTLIQNGWDVVLCGHPGRRVAPKNIKLISFINSFQPSTNAKEFDDNKQQVNTFNNSLKRKLITIIKAILPKKAIKHLSRLYHVFPAFTSRFSDKMAIWYYWNFYNYKTIYNYIKNELVKIQELKHSKIIIVAHDYFTMPIADKLADDFDAFFVADIHEYAKGQYMDNLAWRILLRPWIDRLQKIYLKKSKFNSTVCEGIAELLAKDYNIKKPTVVRSVPSYIKCSFKPTNQKKIYVLYHGLIWNARGMELAMQSLKLWRPEFHLIFRGPCLEEYSKELIKYAEKLGINDRFTIEKPVLFEEIIPEANKADIGYFVHKDISPQKRFTLPNKLFEYIGAGLALCVSDLPEMARITNKHNLGLLVQDYSIEAVAEKINSFTRESIDSYKKNSLEAAKELCWENEQQLILKPYTELIDCKNENERQNSKHFLPNLATST